MKKNFRIWILFFLAVTLSSCQRIIDDVIDLAIISVVAPIVIILVALIFVFFKSDKKK